jgi:hypothetical protein
MRAPARRLAAVATATALLLPFALPAVTTATVDGGCTVTGTSTSGGSVDLAKQAEWHLKSTDSVSGTGTAPSPQTSASVGAYALGLTIPIASGTGDGATTGSVDNVSISMFAFLGARFMVSGSSTGAGGGCTGHVLIVLDDVNPLLTALGGGGIAIAVIAALLLFLAMRGGGGIGSRIVMLVIGVVGGAGLGLALAQFGVLSPDSIVGLVVPIAGGAVGLLTPGALHGSGG